MPLDHQTVRRWLDDYVRAWESYDPSAIGELFSEDATYAWHPWDKGDDVVSGRAAIVEAWLADKDKPGTYKAAYAPIAVDGDVAVATGQSQYFDKASGALQKEFHNCFVMRFDSEGRCREFTELFMQTPQRLLGTG
jgi:ketosteroid isomerase-like protein